MAGLVVALLAFIVLGVAGLIGEGRADVLLLFIQFLSLVIAGYVGGRLSGVPELHGGLAALLCALISGMISISSSDVGLVGIATLAVVAVVLGTAGGVLARWHKQAVEVK